MDDLVECEAFLGGTKRVPRERLEYRPSVYAVVIHEGQMLVVTNAGTGRYYLPGGAVELGERQKTALRREVREETGIDIAIGDLVGFRENFFYYDPLDAAYHALLFLYRCTPKTFDLLSNDEIEDGEARDPCWVDIDALRAGDFHAHGEWILEIVASARM